MTGVLQPGGSASGLRRLGRTFAAKTGTSNNSLDAWFVGVTPDLVIATFVGFDDPRTLGKHDFGGTIASPIFKQFVDTALKDEPRIPFRVPAGIRFMRVDHRTGKPAKPKDRDVVLEAFKVGEDWQGKVKGYIDGSDSETPARPASPDRSAAENADGDTAAQTEEPDDNIPGIGGIF